MVEVSSPYSRGGCCNTVGYIAAYAIPEVFQARIHGSGCCNRTTTAATCRARIRFKPGVTGVGVCNLAASQLPHPEARFQARIHGSGCCDGRYAPREELTTGRFKPVFTGVGVATRHYEAIGDCVERRFQARIHGSGCCNGQGESLPAAAGFVASPYSREWVLQPLAYFMNENLAGWFQARIHGSGCCNHQEAGGAGQVHGFKPVFTGVGVATVKVKNVVTGVVMFQARIHGSGCCNRVGHSTNEKGALGFQARIHGSGCCNRTLRKPSAGAV